LFTISSTLLQLECPEFRKINSTTNITDNDEQILLNPSNNRSLHNGYIKYLHNGRRFILKNSKWYPLCKYDNICRNMAKYELLCIKHYELNQQKRRDIFKIPNNNNQRSHSSIFVKHHSIVPNHNKKRLKTNDFQISSSSITKQFDINSNENSYTLTEPVNNNFSLLTSKHSNNETSSKFKTNQSVQTDITIPLCCMLHQEDHSFHSSCENNKSTSSILSYDTKSEPNFSK